ncbi:hypothetical protein KR222_007155, partial [Zaprionus bogoriensis]
TSVEPQNVTEKGASPDQLQSLIEISGSSAKSSDNRLVQRSEVERIVKQTLKQMQATCFCENIDTLVTLIVPKVISELRAYDQLHEEVQTIKQSLNSYMQHSKAVDEDIAEIFLDLHNIYKKIEALGDLEARKIDDKKFCKRLQQAESFLQSSQHYIT